MDADAAAAKRFLEKITPKKSAPQPVPTAVATEPPGKPQAPVETKPEDREASYRRRFDDEVGGTVELLMFPEFFSEQGDDVTVANAVRVFQWVLDQGKWVSRTTVAEAVKALRKALTPLAKPEVRRPEPEKALASLPVKSDPKPQPVVATPIVDDLPPLSPWVWKQLGSNKMLTRQDVKAIPNFLYSELYRNNKYGPEFQKRVNAVLALGR